MTGGHAGKISRSCLREIYINIPYKRKIEEREYIMFIQNEMKYYPQIQEYFWIDAGIREEWVFPSDLIYLNLQISF